MADALENPLVAAYFSLELGDGGANGVSGLFLEVSGIGSESEVVEHKVVGEKNETIIQKIPGRLTWGDVTLKRGVTSNIDMWNWRQKVVDGKVAEARLNGSIVAYDQEAAEVARWNIVNAWPSKIDGPAPKSDSSDVMIEELTIVHEGITRAS